MSDEFDPFKGSTGLLEDEDFTFSDCRFAVDPNYKDQNQEMMPVFKANLSAAGEVRDQIFSIGKGWNIEDGGAKVVREGEAKGFNNSSYIQTIINRLLDLDEQAVRARWEDTGLTPQDAGYWEGLTVHMVNEDYQKGFGPKAETGQRLMPTAIIGWNVEAEKPKPAKKAAAVKKTAKKAAAKPAEEAGADDAPVVKLDEVRVALRAIADECQEYEEYIDRAYAEIDGIDTTPAIAELAEADGEGSVWAEAVAAAGE